ncbi:hypothetical protein DV701_13710 [Ornithinimicrobium avium]|uniref:Glycosyltransferase n=1 Tax=Ornithinimicrobium avium TaxID=2283195 RepID=A0A345NPS9_9MICO|nr:hypothetical protein DV701_13710 [Ornithinimicrobium avium]
MVEAGGLRAEEVRMDLMQHYREDVLHSAGMPEELPGQLGMVGGVARLLAPEVARTMRGLAGRYDSFVTTALSATWPGLFGSDRPQVLMMFVPAIPSAWGDSSLFSVAPGRSVHNVAAGLRGMYSAMGAVAPGLEPGTAGITRRDRRRGVLGMATAPAFIANTAQLVTPRRVAGRRVRVIGYPFLGPAADAALPADLEAFLAAGPPPVSVGLGSHTVPAVREAIRGIVAAALSAGRRVAVMRGSGLEDEDGHDERVAFVGDVPHDLLFPRTAAVVQHGGAGTSAVALRTGRPRSSCRSPWTNRSSPVACTRSGRRSPGAGAGRVRPGRGGAGRGLGAERVGASLARVLEPAVAARAAQVAAAVRGEDGVAGAVALIEQELGAGSETGRAGAATGAHRRPGCLARARPLRWGAWDGRPGR